MFYNNVSKQKQIATSFGETNTNEYQTIDIKFGLKPFKNFNIGFAVLNVFNETYNGHLNFSFINQENFGRTPLNESGRNFYVFLQYKIRHL